MKSHCAILSVFQDAWLQVNRLSEKLFCLDLRSSKEKFNKVFNKSFCDAVKKIIFDIQIYHVNFSEKYINLTTPRQVMFST